MSKVREIAWPEEFSGLKTIEEYMICGICYDYMDTSVITPCSHNYCSLCIRKYLHYKPQCPACFNEFYEKDLYINRSMDGLIRDYIQIREKIITLIENRNVYNAAVQQKEAGVLSPVQPSYHSKTMTQVTNTQSVQSPKTPKSSKKISVISNFGLSSPKTVVSKSEDPKTPSSPFLQTSSVCSQKDAMLSPSTNRSLSNLPSLAKMFTPKRKETVSTASVPVTSVKSVSCPVCSVDISEQHVNVHLDACLKRETAEKQIKEKPKVKNNRPPLPKLVLRVMKEAELRKKMRELGLSTQGDRRTLENRFTRYSTIYNSECDKLEPRSIPELLRQCEMEEKQERKMDMFLVPTVTANRLVIERNADEKKIEEAQKSYRETNKSSFDKLIEDMKKRQQKSKEEKSKNSSTDYESSTSKNKMQDKKENVSDKDEDMCLVTDINESFENSDSEQDCPLQHYTREDSKKFLTNANLDDSSNSNILESPVKKPQITSNLPSPKPSTSKDFNPYDVSTDESDGESNLTKPLKRRGAAKRFKTDDVDEMSLDDRVKSARELCNSIIDDFDDSSNEFAEKLKKAADRDLKENSITNLEEINKLNKSKLRNSFGIKANLAIEEDNQEDSDFSFNSSSEFINSSIVESKINQVKINNKSKVEDSNKSKVIENVTSKTNEFEKPSMIGINVNKFRASKNNEIVDNDAQKIFVEEKSKVDESDKIFPELVLSNLGKENATLPANNDEVSTGDENSARRPVRQRTRPMRYTDNEVSNRDNAPAEKSLKRRRGRPPSTNNNTIDNSSDDALNPAKRPVRRGQTPLKENVC
ncbi:E3 ubiquitin-protein ligase RAD18-like [Trichogramma pretiosum]|uniref:E3 ubiquitin-protein ligase RAD18-like n=1 Tax=Trichogramma pretiosum TaxID=7493 RepID=UPI000C71C7F9|nr:E3 ubiquitin-protein ligase RAD18-like [Trichogramma pretiosum]